MLSVPTLYSLCLDYIKNHTEEIVSIEGVPFHPTIEVILNHVFTSTDSPLNSSFLSAVAKSYDDELRSANLPWTKVVLSKGASRSAIPSFIALSTEFPKFITHLDISRCNIDDDDLLLLKGFSNLKVLHMCHNPDISDIGISYLTNMAVSSFIGMPYLEGLNLSGLSRVTDKSLKCFRKLSSIIYLNISNTSVIDIVAQKFLTSLGFHQIRTANKALPCVSTMAVDMAANDKFYWFLREIAFKYDTGQKAEAPSFIHSHETFCPPALYFLRNKDTLKRKEQLQQQHPKPVFRKKQRLSTTDFLNMIESEYLND